MFAEHLVLSRARMGQLAAVSLRPFNVFGPGQMGEGAVRNFAALAVRGENLKVTGDGSATRAWLYVDDFVEAVLAVVATPQSWGRSYNVGNPDTLVSTKDLATRILEAAGRGGQVEYVPHPGTDVRARWPKTEALRTATGWSAKIGLDEGIARTVAFWEGQGRDDA